MYCLKDDCLEPMCRLVIGYLQQEGRPADVDVLKRLLMISFSMWASGGDKEALAGENGTQEALAGEKEVFLTKLGVPVIKGIMTHKTEKEWVESIQGLSPMDVTTSIALPEFDALITGREGSERSAQEGATDRGQCDHLLAVRGEGRIRSIG
jgi:cobaltochelatase CobN